MADWAKRTPKNWLLTPKWGLSIHSNRHKASRCSSTSRHGDLFSTKPGRSTVTARGAWERRRNGESRSNGGDFRDKAGRQSGIWPARRSQHLPSARTRGFRLLVQPNSCLHSTKTGVTFGKSIRSQQPGYGTRSFFSSRTFPQQQEPRVSQRGLAAGKRAWTMLGSGLHVRQLPPKASAQPGLLWKHQQMFY